MIRLNKKFLYMILCILCVIILVSCGTAKNYQTSIEQLSDVEDNNQENSDYESSFETDTKKIVISGIKNDYKLLIINDMHILCSSDDISDEKSQEVKQRYESFVDLNDQTSAKSWDVLSKEIDSYNADAVLMAGDMVDFYSPSNLECLKDGIDNIKTSLMYVRADHDYGTWYIDEEKSIVNEKEQNIADNDEILTIEFPDFIIVGINNSTSQISKTGIKKLSKIWKMNKPVILVTHVQINSQISDDLAKESNKNWGNRALLWGEDCYYIPNKNTKKYLNMVLNEDSPVAAVISGHLHFPYTINLNKSITEYVFDASYKGTIGVIEITGE